MSQALNFKLKATKTQKENKNSIFFDPSADVDASSCCKTFNTDS